MSPIKIIDALREADEYMEYIFTGGSCYHFFIFLKKLFPSARPFINKSGDHVVTEIEGRFYDITGEVPAKGFALLTDLSIVEKWSFRNNNLLKLTECPFCEEEIPIEEPLKV